MNRRLKAALVFTGAGYLTAAAALIKTTPLIMTLFSFVGIACFGAGFFLYASVVIGDLRSHDVL